MAFGTIKWYLRSRGLGLIESDKDGEIVFLHRSKILGDTNFPESIRGRKVSFETEAGIRGPRAFNAQVLPKQE